MDFMAVGILLIFILLVGYLTYIYSAEEDDIMKNIEANRPAKGPIHQRIIHNLRSRTVYKKTDDVRGPVLTATSSDDSPSSSEASSSD
jgi:hypothetical protein